MRGIRFADKARQLMKNPIGMPVQFLRAVAVYQFFLEKESTVLSQQWYDQLRRRRLNHSGTNRAIESLVRQKKLFILPVTSRYMKVVAR